MNLKQVNINLIGLLMLFFLNNTYGQQNTNPQNPYAVTTYECAGFYWKTNNKGECNVRYRDAKSGTWEQGLVLSYDARDGEYRGSIVGLIPNTVYEAELNVSGLKSTLKFSTRNDVFPIGKTTILPAGESDKLIVINESGSPNAYHLVTVPLNSKSVVNIKNVYDYGVEIDADYVIVRGIEIRNAAIHGIVIKKNRHDVVVEQCHITFWGRVGGPRTFGNHDGDMDSGVFGEAGCKNITVQRNLIDNPRGGSNDWETGHPSGPQGITFMQNLGGNVVRYNELVTTEDHGFNDGIGGGDNFSWEGNMNRDADIYGNIIRSAWDDAIECEGANMNVRIWGNYVHFYYNGIATATTSKGPLYIFRNVLGESRKSHRSFQGGALIKTGERNEYGGGRKYIFHNTAVQPNGAYNVFTSHVNPNCVSRNNIFDVPGQLATHEEKEPASDYDYDFFSGTEKGTAKELHGKEMHAPALGPFFIPSYSLDFYPSSSLISRISGKHPIEYGDKTIVITDPVVQLKSPLIDSGVVLPGFNTNFKGEAPDLGAFEIGNPPLLYGRRANLGFDKGWVPWEKF